MTCGIVTYRICDTISNQHNVVRAQIKCHTEWLCDHGLSAEPVLLDRADKCFRYLLGARSRTDLDARLRIWMTEVVPQIFSDDTELQEEYIDYMLTTRFAPEDHEAFLFGDRRAMTHAAYGSFEQPLSSRFNMNLESFIKQYLVTQHHRKAMRTVLTAFMFLSGYSCDGMPVPASLIHLVETLKARDPKLRLPRFYLHDKYEVMCAWTNFLITGGVIPTENSTVWRVSHRTSHMRNLTDDPDHLRNAYSHDDETRACVEQFDACQNRVFEELDPPVHAELVYAGTHRVLLTENQKKEQVTRHIH